MKRLFILCAFCLISLTVHAQRFALLDFQLGTNVTTEEIDALTYNFRANFFIDGYRDIPGSRINGTIEALGFNRTDMSRQQILKLSRELGAKLVVVGTINKLMDEYTVEVSALDVSTGLTLETVGATFIKSEYRSAMETLAAKLGDKLANYGLADSRADVGSGSRSSGVGGSTGYSKSATSGSINGHEWVDLGLSVKWATCNVGASSPSGYGNYYAWGETSTKGEYSWNTYHNHSDDAARANWGGTWRMPTDAEWTELRTRCKWTWTGNGYTVTGPNGNSIFLPAAGYRRGTSLGNAGSHGYYWSSSLNTDNPYRAWDVSFYSGEVYRYYYNRYYGFSVRPVSE